MLVRKGNYLKFKTVNTPQHSQRRATAAKLFDDDGIGQVAKKVGENQLFL